MDTESSKIHLVVEPSERLQPVSSNLDVAENNFKFKDQRSKVRIILSEGASGSPRGRNDRARAAAFKRFSSLKNETHRVTSRSPKKLFLFKGTVQNRVRVKCARGQGVVLYVGA